MAIYRKKKFTSPKKVGGLGPPGPIGSAANAGAYVYTSVRMRPRNSELAYLQYQIATIMAARARIAAALHVI